AALTRIVVPARSKNCDHVQCFDARTFLELNKQIPTWKCPLCSSPVVWDDVRIDEYDVLAVRSQSRKDGYPKFGQLGRGLGRTRPGRQVEADLRRRLAGRRARTAGGYGGEPGQLGRRDPPDAAGGIDSGTEFETCPHREQRLDTAYTFLAAGEDIAVPAIVRDVGCGAEPSAAGATHGVEPFATGVGPGGGPFTVGAGGGLGTVSFTVYSGSTFYGHSGPGKEEFAAGAISGADPFAPGVPSGAQPFAGGTDPGAERPTTAVLTGRANSAAGSHSGHVLGAGDAPECC
ncbi:MAG: MIZ/SP-RING zinc finger-domain-containing protein, partial [Olpidium bornovanus]